MGWQIWRRSSPQELSGKVKQALISQFKVDSLVVGKLRLLEKSGRFARRHVTLIRIFDPAFVESSQVAGLKYDDFETTGHRKALVFNGHIESGGEIYLTQSA